MIYDMEKVSVCAVCSNVKDTLIHCLTAKYRGGEGRPLYFWAFDERLITQPLQVVPESVSEHDC